MRIWLITFVIFSLNMYASEGFISVPVADLLGSPIEEFYPSLEPCQAYKKLAFCGGQPKQAIACPRIHQALFNQRVHIIKEKEQEVMIQLANVFFYTQQNMVQHNCFWTLRSNITSFDTTKNLDTIHRAIPQSYDFHHKSIPQNTLGLIQPWYDRKTDMKFSVGTRFVLHENQMDDEHYRVYIYNPETDTISISSIPQTHCIKPCNDRSTQRENFVWLVKKWAHPHKGIIPYVWGGCSIRDIQKSDKYIHTCETRNDKKYCQYTYPTNHNYPITGVDCSGAILLAAQLVGIPYFAKNSTTITQCLQPLQEQHPLENGDIIFIKGHVMIVSDLTKNKLIEARGYDDGYGKFQEIELCKVFANIQTFEDLKKCYFKKKPIKRLNSKGNITKPIFSIGLFKLN